MVQQKVTRLDVRLVSLTAQQLVGDLAERSVKK
jgi:hypothetical protein